MTAKTLSKAMAALLAASALTGCMVGPDYQGQLTLP